ncbi:MAG: rhodanese-like domain-containing protein [Propionibacteriaceae bacterium]|jgi:rhodanese-related sulfurtransferase|nr:rhodanese-like domain-containing protein [Propionibacteriaceae bacterium]
MRRLSIALAALSFVVIATGCVSQTSGGSSVSPSLSPDAVVIDVRTPQEYADGHLEGALNIDSASPDLQAELGELDKDGEYILYCRSGRRAGDVFDLMKGDGFINVVNLGGIDDASESTGLPIVS